MMGTFVMMVAVILALATGILFTMQLRLIWVNQTTFELSMDPFRHPYNHKSVAKNF